MPRRLEIELTSRRDDSTWTWRAAGARQPKGVLDAGLLPGDAAVGVVLRAEVEQTLDSLDVLSVHPIEDKRAAPERIEVIGTPRRDEQLVTSTLTGRDSKGRDGKGRGRGRGEGRDGGGRGRPEGRGTRDHRDRPGSSPDGRADRGTKERRERPKRSFTPPPPLPERPKPKRLRPLRTHRAEAIAALPEEQRPIAEQALRGGIPGVRKALEEQNEQAAANGLPVAEAKGIVALAEKMLPALRAAEWMDRAEAALGELEELDLRDLRSVVAASEQGARGEDARKMAEELRTGLARRVEHDQREWLEELDELLRAGRVARALRVASRPPKAGSLLPEPLAARLVQAANEAMTAETGSERYATIVDAAATSPVHARVVPLGVPAEPTPELRKAVKRAAKRAPAVAKAFGFGPGGGSGDTTTESSGTASPRVPPPPNPNVADAPQAAVPPPAAAQSTAPAPSSPAAPRIPPPPQIPAAQPASEPATAPAQDAADTPTTSESAPAPTHHDADLPTSEPPAASTPDEAAAPEHVPASEITDD